MTEEGLPYYFIQEPAKAAESAHEHLYRVEAREQDDRSFL